MNSKLQTVNRAFIAHSTAILLACVLVASKTPMGIVTAIRADRICPLLAAPNSLAIRETPVKLPHMASH